MKQLIEVKIMSCKKCLAAEELDSKLEYKRNDVRGEREVRRRHRAS